MPRPTPEQFEDRFAAGLTLDHLWSETMGLPVDDKEKVLASLVAVLESTGTPYAVIGVVAMQLYTEEPRTTAALDIALRSAIGWPNEFSEILARVFRHNSTCLRKSVQYVDHRHKTFHDEVSVSPEASSERRSPQKPLLDILMRHAQSCL